MKNRIDYQAGQIEVARSVPRERLASEAGASGSDIVIEPVIPSRGCSARRTDPEAYAKRNWEGDTAGEDYEAVAQRPVAMAWQVRVLEDAI